MTPFRLAHLAACGVANPPYMIGGLRMARPGMAAAIVHQREDAWARELRFLDEHLAIMVR